MLNLVKNTVRSLGINVHPYPSDRHLALDYPVSRLPRYGYAKPVHPAINAMLEVDRPAFAARLKEIGAGAALLQGVPALTTSDPLEPCWNNGWLPPLDAAALMHFIAAHRPARYLEIGSGNSTLFARRAIRVTGTATTITSIDPQPRRGIDAVCDTIVRQPLETVDPATFDSLDAGDILFFDGSHRVFADSDVTVFFLEILPRIRPGVLVQVHDIFWPYDYPPEWGTRYYSEQYMLAMYLLYARPEILLANAFISRDQALAPLAADLTPGDPMYGYWGVSFWFRTVQPLAQ